MKKTLNFGNNHKVEVNSSAGWLYVYREQFGRDILPDVMPILESVIAAIGSVLQESEGKVTKDTILGAMNNDLLVDAFIKLSGMETITVLNVLWSMAKNADEGIAEPRQFYNELDTVPIDVIVPELFKLILESSVSSKNAGRLLGAMKNLRANQSGSTPSPSQA